MVYVINKVKNIFIIYGELKINQVYFYQSRDGRCCKNLITI